MLYLRKLTELAGVSATTIANLEAGHAAQNETIGKLLEVLEVT